MDQAPINELIALLIFTGAHFYVPGKIVLDYQIGKDSLWSRYLNRPLTNYLTGGELGTEEQFQNALAYNKQQIKRVGLAKLIKALP